MQRETKFWLAAFLVALALAVLGPRWYFSEGAIAGRARDDALARWAEREPASYRFEFDYCAGMCASCPRTVTVEHGVVTRVVHHNPRCGEYDGLTVEDVFELEEETRSASWAGEASVRYDPFYGYPDGVGVLCASHGADCGVGFGISRFEPLP